MFILRRSFPPISHDLFYLVRFPLLLIFYQKSSIEVFCIIHQQLRIVKYFEDIYAKIFLGGTNMTFRERLKDLREELFLTQKEVAEQSDLSPQCISQLEAGQRSPTAITLLALADCFDCSIDYLMGRTDKPNDYSFHDFPQNLSAEEQQLLSDFRKLPRPERAQATEYIHYLADKRGIKNKHA